MLTSTFCHIPGVTAADEKLLWDAGVHSWSDFETGRCSALGPAKVNLLSRHLEESRLRLEQGDSAWFASRLPAREQWRMFEPFRAGVAYLDIETTGLSRQRHHVTTVALYDGERLYHFVQGENLERLGEFLSTFRLLVTYNGKCFDVPFLRDTLGVIPPTAHIDLRYVLGGLGLRGGLKGCERHLGLGRGELDGVDGMMAVRLWQLYRRTGDRAALETLLAYNMEDVISLEALLVYAFNKKLEQTPFASSRLFPSPCRPQVPFTPDAKILSRLLRPGA